jgi:hypothetical protein
MKHKCDSHIPSLVQILNINGLVFEKNTFHCPSNPQEIIGIDILRV